MHAAAESREDFEQAANDGDADTLYRIAGKLWTCTDIMPSSLCDEFDMPYGSSYAQAARRVRAGGAAT